MNQMNYKYPENTATEGIHVNLRPIPDFAQYQSAIR